MWSWVALCREEEQEQERVVVVVVHHLIFRIHYTIFHIRSIEEERRISIAKEMTIITIVVMKEVAAVVDEIEGVNANEINGIVEELRILEMEMGIQNALPPPHRRHVEDGSSEVVVVEEEEEVLAAVDRVLAVVVVVAVVIVITDPTVEIARGGRVAGAAVDRDHHEVEVVETVVAVVVVVVLERGEVSMTMMIVEKEEMGVLLQ